MANDKTITITLNTAGVVSGSKIVASELGKIDHAGKKVQSIKIGLDIASFERDYRKIHAMFHSLKALGASTAASISQTTKAMNVLGNVAAATESRFARMSSSVVGSINRISSAVGALTSKYRDLSIHASRFNAASASSGVRSAYNLSSMGGGVGVGRRGGALNITQAAGAGSGAFGFSGATVINLAPWNRISMAQGALSAANYTAGGGSGFNPMATPFSSIPTTGRGGGSGFNPMVTPFSSIPTTSRAVVPTPQSISASASAVSSFTSRLQGLQTQLSKVSTVSHTVTSSLFSFKNMLVGMAIGGVIKQLQDVVMATQRIKNSFMAATDSTEGMNKEWEYAVDISRNLGLDLKTSAVQLAQMEIAAKGSSLEGKGVRDVFEAVSKAAVVMGLSADQAAGAHYALQQMMSKGRVSTEELRRQLGERLPGAFQFAAKAMGVTAAQLDKMLDQGEVYAEEMLPKLARVLNEEFGKALPMALQNLQAQMNRLSTSFFLTKGSIAGGGFTEAYSSFIGSLRVALDEFVSSGAADKFGKWLGDFIEYGSGIIRVWTGVPDLLNKNSESFRGMASAIEAVAASITALMVGGAAARFGGAFLLFLFGGPVGWTVAGIAAITGALVYFRREILALIHPAGSLKNELKELRDTAMGLKELAGKGGISQGLSEIELEWNKVQQAGNVYSQLMMPKEYVYDSKLGAYGLPNEGVEEARRNYLSLLASFEFRNTSFIKTLNSLYGSIIKPQSMEGKKFVPEVEESTELKNAKKKFADYAKDLQHSVMELEFDLSSLQVEGIHRRIKEVENGYLLELALRKEKHAEMLEEAKKHGLDTLEVQKRFDSESVLAEEIKNKRILEIRQDFMQDALEKEQKEHEQYLERIKNQTERVREMYDPAYLKSTRQKELGEMLSVGGLPSDVATKYEMAIELEYMDAIENGLRLQEDLILKVGDAWDGARVAMSQYARTFKSEAANMYEFWKDTIGKMEDVLTDFLSGKGLNFKSLLESMQESFNRNMIVRPLMSSWFGNHGGTGQYNMFSGGMGGGMGGGFGGFWDFLFGGNGFLGFFDEGGISRGKGFYAAATDELHIPLNKLSSVTNSNVKYEINFNQAGEGRRKRLRGGRLGQSERQAIRDTQRALNRF